jgi:Cys-tRNA(Pro)/Cys-tRNA(Cys) deacylase
MAKPNALRLLESEGIAYRAISYEVDEADLSAPTVAAKIGIEPERVFKTLLALGDSGSYTLFCVPSDMELDLKKAAKASGEKGLSLAPIADLERITGYVRGGCSPIGTKRLLPVWIDETALLHAEITVSAGMRGMQVALDPQALASVVGGSFADLT